MDSIIYDLWLSLKVGTNTSFCRDLLDEFGSAENVYNQNFKENDILSDKDLTDAENEYSKCMTQKVCLISYTDEIYPNSFKDTENPPLVLYCKGNVDLLKRPMITVAGSKKCSPDGKINARRFVSAMYDSGIVPVTPFSPGIEAEVAKSVDECIAVMPCGIDKTYPAKHYNLKNKLISGGGLVLSAQPLSTPALGYNIVSRNHLVAALSDCSFIVEAGENSGTAIIFNKCLEYSKRCFVIPGSISSPFYVGNNSFLKKGATAVTQPQDIINFYTVMYPDIIENSQETLYDDTVLVSDDEIYDDCENSILKALSGCRLNYDELVEKSSLSASEAASAITTLEMIGVIENIGGVFAVK